MADHSGSDGSGPSDAAARDALLGRAAPSAQDNPSALRILGGYQVLASIGRGGMGEILLAQYRSKGQARLAALKVLASEDEDLVKMFMDEAALMARIRSPHVLEVFEFGRDAGEFFLAMEYLQGRPLVRLMIDSYQNLGGIDYGIVAAIGAGAAEGLADAHEATGADGKPLQIVHRDVSPQNIFVTYEGLAKVIDFGVARARERLTKTAVGHVKGKAAYMSPEQVDGREEIDGRSDVFALGICLWEMTAGRRLFKRDSDYETMMAVSEGPVVSPTKMRRHPDPELDRILFSALTRSPKRRTQSAREFAQELRAYAASKGLADPKRAIAELMERLYGEEAARERELLAAFSKRLAEPTLGEVEALRTLSGISPRPEPDPVQEVTLIGRPEDMVALDAFRAPMDEEEQTILNVRPPRARAMSALPRLSVEERAVVVERAVQSLNEQYQREKLLRRVGHPVKRGRRPLSRGVRGLGLWLGRIALLLMVLLGAGSIALLASKTHHEEAAISRPAPAQPTVETERLAPRPRPVREAMRALAEQGVRFEVGTGIYRVVDQRGGPPVPIAWDATFAPVSAHGLDGAFFRSVEPGTVYASFIGRVDGGAVQVEALSVNDCPAALEATAEGVQVRYGQQSVLVAVRPVQLHSARFSLPRFADRVELLPLALSFGRRDPDASTVHCDSGLGGNELRFERVPAGEYELVFTGEGQSERRAVRVPVEEKKPKRRRRAPVSVPPG